MKLVSGEQKMEGILFWIDCPNRFCNQKYEFTEVVESPVHIECECGYSFDFSINISE